MWLSALLVGAAALLLFLDAVRNGFVNFDDPVYVTDNADVRRGLDVATVRWAFGAIVSSNYHPITMLSHALDVSLFGLDPRGHHLTSVLLHAVNCALVVLVGHALLGDLRASTLAALLFAVHPLRAESVAWVSERKDVLSALFFLLCLLAFIRGRRAASAPMLVLAWVFFGIGMLSKPMLVTLPALLAVLEPVIVPLDTARLAYDLRARALRLVPFFLVGVAGVVGTLLAQRGALMDLARQPLWARLGAAPVHVVRYLGKTVWPVDLSVVVPLPPDGYGAAAVVGSVLTLALVTAVVFTLRRRAPMAVAGWLWFVGMLVPVLGLTQAGRAAIADRYTLLPHVGLFLALSVLVVRSRVLLVLAALATVALVPVTVRAIGVWRTTSTLFANAVANEPGSAFTQDALAGELLASGQAAAAEEHARVAVALAPQVPQYRERLAQVLVIGGRAAEAEALLRAVMLDAPERARTHWLLSALLHQHRRDAEAEAELRTAYSLAEAAGDRALLDTLRPLVRSLGGSSP